MTYLEHDTILRIHEEALNAGLGQKRELLLGGMNVQYTAGLNVVADPAGQVCHAALCAADRSDDIRLRPGS